MRSSMGAVMGIVHDVGPRPIVLAPIGIKVGFCKVYEEGPTVLLTLDQGISDEVEIAIRPSMARELAAMLIRSAESMEKAGRS